jgi:hypothetical protein
MVKILGFKIVYPLRSDTRCNDEVNFKPVINLCVYKGMLIHRSDQGVSE